MAGDSEQSREERMVVIERDWTGMPTIWCDPEIVDLVKALNAGDVPTVASCSGHGQRPGSIALADGRWLIIARDEAERAQIDAIFPLDVNGELMVNPAVKVLRAAQEVSSEFVAIEAARGAPLHETYANRSTGETETNRVFISVAVLRKLLAAVGTTS